MYIVVTSKVDRCSRTLEQENFSSEITCETSKILGKMQDFEIRTPILEVDDLLYNTYICSASKLLIYSYLHSYFNTCT